MVGVVDLEEGHVGAHGAVHVEGVLEEVEVEEVEVAVDEEGGARFVEQAHVLGRAVQLQGPDRRQDRASWPAHAKENDRQLKSGSMSITQLYVGSSICMAEK